MLGGHCIAGRPGRPGREGERRSFGKEGSPIAAVEERNALVEDLRKGDRGLGGAEARGAGEEETREG